MIYNRTFESPIDRSVSGMGPGLVAIDGPLSGQTFYLDEPEVSIGRLASNGIRLEDPFVSRHHCIIRTEGDGYMIEDLNSANGTYVNDVLVKACSLKEGSIIQVGTSRFLFSLQNPEEPIALSQNLVGAENGHSSSGEIRLG